MLFVNLKVYERRVPIIYEFQQQSNNKQRTVKITCLQRFAFSSIEAAQQRPPSVMSQQRDATMLSHVQLYRISRRVLRYDCLIEPTNDFNSKANPKSVSVLYDQRKNILAQHQKNCRLYVGTNESSCCTVGSRQQPGLSVVKI